MGGLKRPFTNTAKWSLFCSPKVNISLLFTEDLQNGEILGENWINDGFYWGSVTGICCANWERVCGRLAAGRGLLQRHSYHRSPRGPSFCSCKRKQNRAKGNQAFPFANPFDAKLRLDTNDALASSVRRRRYAPKVPAAHFILDFAGTELKINLISVVASDATFA